MRHLGTFFVLSTVTVFATGCGQFGGSSSSSARGGMAVVDLDKVAAETGRDQQMAQALELRQNSLNQSYAKWVETAKDELNTKKKGYGESISDDEKKEFAELERAAIAKLTQVQNEARNQFGQYKQNQIARFRTELKPITQEIAAKRGLSIVIPKNEGLLLSVDPGVDITDEVIKVLQQKHPVVAPAVESPAPASNAKMTPAKRNSSPAKSASRTAALEEDEEEAPVR